MHMMLINYQYHESEIFGAQRKLVETSSFADLELLFVVLT